MEINNLFSQAFRSLRQQKGFAVLNFLGLATAITICLLAALLVFHERSFDNFHKEGERLFRVVTQMDNPHDETMQFAEVAVIVQSLLANELADLRPTPWSGEVATEDVLTALNQHFVTVAADPVANLPMKVADYQLAESPLLNQSLSWIDLIKEAVQANPHVTLPPKVWMALFESSGWATEETSGNAH